MPTPIEIEPEEDAIIRDEEVNEIVLYRAIMPRKRNLLLAGCIALITTLLIVLGVTLRNSPSTSSTSSTDNSSSSSDTVDPSTLWRLLGEPLRDDTWQDISLALSNDGRIVAVGNRNLPVVQMFEFSPALNSNNNARWVSRGSITGPHKSFGVDLALSTDGDTVAIGGHLRSTTGSFVDDGPDGGQHAGHVQAWSWDNVTNNYVQLGSDIVGEDAGDQAGKQIAINSDGTIMAVGGHMNSEVNQRAGHVRVYELVGGDWLQMGSDIDGLGEGDQFGGSLGMSADGFTLAIGGRFHDDEEQNSGHVQVYKYTQGAWNKKGDDLEGVAKDEEFGYSLALSGDGNTVAIGNSLNQVAVYEYVDDEWIPLKKYLDLEGDDVFLLVSLSFDGKTLAVLEKPRNQKPSKVTILHYVEEDWVLDGFTFTGQALALSGNGQVLAIGGIEENSANETETVRILKENGQVGGD